MNKKLVYSMLLVTILTGLLVASNNINKVEASGTIYIRADGSIDGPANITTVDYVTYYFNESNYDEIVVERDNIVVDGAGYTVQKTGGYKGILLSGINNVTIKNMRIQAFNYGIYLEDSSNITVSGNTIANNSYGIHLYGSSNNTLSGNNATNNYVVGIGLSGSSNNTVSGNTIANSTYGINLGSSSNINSVYANNITNSTYGVKLQSCSNNFLHANLLNDNQYGFDSGGGWGDSAIICIPSTPQTL